MTFFLQPWYGRIELGIDMLVWVASLKREPRFRRNSSASTSTEVNQL